MTVRAIRAVPFDAPHFTVAQARALGVSASRLRGRDLDRPFHGIRSSHEVVSLEARCRALQVSMRPDQFFSHATAAGLYGIPLPVRVERERMLHVGAVRPAAPPRRAGVAGHRLSPLDWTLLNETTPHGTAPDETALDETTRELDGVRLASPALAWCMLAETLSVADLVAAADFLVSQTRPFASISALARAAEAWRHRPGAPRLAEALPQVRMGVRSRKETHARLVILAAGLPEPELNARIYSPDGNFLAMPDLVWRAHRVGAEYEGDHHRSDRRQFRHDIIRRERVEDFDWRLVRFTSDDLSRATAEFVTRIASRLGVSIGSAAVARAVRLGSALEP